MKNRLIILVCLIAGIAIPTFAQKHVPGKERGDSNLRRKITIDENEIRAVIYNSGLSGRIDGNDDPIPYEWPKGSGNPYIALTTMWFGAEVTGADGRKYPIVSASDYRNAITGGGTWNNQPVPGYNQSNVNLDQKLRIANIKNPGSWPSTWPDKLTDPADPGWAGKWNGYFGKDIKNADQEIYFRTSDDQNKALFNAPASFRPDSTDLNRGGLGLIIDTRVMAWQQILLNNVLFLIYDIKNDGTTDLDKCSIGFYLADFVGFEGNDDIPSYDKRNNIAWATDRDGFNGGDQKKPLGLVGIAFLETPGNNKDRIDNDADGEKDSPIITLEMLVDEDPADGIDNNGNGLIDENAKYLKDQYNLTGNGFADGIDNNNNGEVGNPVVTQAMIDDASLDKWKRWPVNPETDVIQQGLVHLLALGTESLGKKFKDNIDNGALLLSTPSEKEKFVGETGSPVVTTDMVSTASADLFKRYRVPGTTIVLFDLGSEDIGLAYADGIDNDSDGKIDEGIDEDIDEMIDEGRDNFLDDDGDWNLFADDLGLDGVPNTNDTGEGDGIPTSGSGTPFPGEPNIDKTDVDEADMLGITSVAYDNSGDARDNDDDYNWRNRLKPGKYVDPNGVAGDNNLYVASGYFPLKAGQTERFSFAIVFGSNKEAVLRTKSHCQTAYNSGYRFAKAPIQPTVTAVPGNGKVTLYWDDLAEKSFDEYINGILPGQGNDFEGYKVYRASDPNFIDAKVISDGYGDPTYWKPMATYDLIDGYQGFDSSLVVKGVAFDLGNETGLQHTFIDTTVQNGQQYFYAVTSYDRGAKKIQISPTESGKSVSIDDNTKEYQFDRNVVRVVPNAPAAGYVDPSIQSLVKEKGKSTGKIGIRILDPNAIKPENKFRIVFQDTLDSTPKTELDVTKRDVNFKAKNFSLVNITDPAAPDTLVRRSKNFGEQKVTAGFQLEFLPELNPGSIDTSLSKWNKKGIRDFQFKKYTAGNPNPRPGIDPPQKRVYNDYKIIFYDHNVYKTFATTYRIGSVRTFLPLDVNFVVLNALTNDTVKFAFLDACKQLTDSTFAGGSDSRFNAGGIFTDYLLLFESNPAGEFVQSWGVNLNSLQSFRDVRSPRAGDTLYISIKKHFTSADAFTFSTKEPGIDESLAKKALSAIKVVPNPYVGFSTFEKKNQYRSGRGDREIHFIKLPKTCTIRIFNVAGELVKTIDHNSTLDNGTANWNLVTDENLPVSYGVYIYQVDAGSVGTHIGKFAVIK
ncbi:MAG: hypothetical protein LCH54_09265 [Bacteroidetes bacterium]|nr:hypothetical protein [Bacteroidota bacterium]